jgi:hypothetical protein
MFAQLEVPMTRHRYVMSIVRAFNETPDDVRSSLFEWIKDYVARRRWAMASATDASSSSERVSRKRKRSCRVGG